MPDNAASPCNQWPRQHPGTQDCAGKRIRNHARPAKPPIISLEQPGRLRVAHLQALLSISHTTIYQRIKTGLLPKPDGWDLPDRPEGKQGRPYWKTSTIRSFLES